MFNQVHNRHYEKVGNLEPKCIDELRPFVIPNNWKWVRFSTVGILKNGYSFKSSEYANSGIQVVRISDLGDNEICQENAVYYPFFAELNDYLVVNGSFLICQTGSIGKIAWVRDNKLRYLNQRVGMFIPYDACNKKYLWYFLHTNYVLDIWLSAKTSMNGNIKNSDILDILLPLPPISEQERIVSCVEQLLSLVTTIEENQIDIKLLNDDLKKKTLDLAIRGKLVHQDTKDEPASVLLERIRDEKKAQLGKKFVDSYIYKGDDNCYYEKVGAEVKNITEEIPFDIPKTWSWMRLNLLVDFSKSTSVPAEEILDNAWVLDLEDIEKDSGCIIRKKRMSEVRSKSDKHKFSRDNVLYSKLRPYLNKVVVADEDGFCTSEILTFDFSPIKSEYAQAYLMSSFFVNYAMKGAYGVKMPRIGSERGNNALMPIPPLCEQERIIIRLHKILNKLKDEC